MQQMNVKPAFEVEILEGTKKRTVHMMVEGELTTKTIEEPLGYMVYFPSGHSMRVRNHNELKKLGFDRAPNLVDMESGDPVSQPQQQSLKSEVQRKTKPTRAKKEVTDDE